MPTQETLWGSTITVRVSQAQPDATPDWVDISDRVSLRDVGQLTTANGRQTDLSGDDPAQLTLAIRDDDHTYSTGTLIRQARRISVREHFGLHTEDLIDAYIQIPTTSAPMDLADGSQAEITVTVSAMDRLSRLRLARKFVSTLTEYIRFNGSTLVAYWPCTEVQLPFRSLVGTPPNLILTDLGASGGAATTNALLLGFASATPVHADDISGCTVAAVVDASSGFITGAPNIRGEWLGHYPAIGVGQVLTFAGWFYFDPTNNPVSVVTVSFATINEFVDLSFDTAGNVNVFASSTLTGSISGPVMPTRKWTLLGLRYGYNPKVFELQVDTKTYTGALAGAAPGSDSLVEHAGPLFYQGAFAHLQYYVGAKPPNLSAQVLAAQAGLEEQLTGERANTILDYAGVPAGVRDIDPGVAVMSRARLAGKDPLTCLEEARRTEQGRLFMSGDGRVQFRDRQRNYNI